MKKGLFVVFEGVDGAGKTTQVNRLYKALSDKGYSVVLLRDPGSTLLGEKLREILLCRDSVIDIRAEAFLYAAARSQLVSEKIIPALKLGQVVISDRFVDSTYAYQGAARGNRQEFLDDLNKSACWGIAPDLTVLLDIDPVKAATRRSQNADRIEGEGQQFLKRVRQGYLNRAAENPKGYLVLDAAISPESLFQLIMAEVSKLLNVDDIKK